MLKDYKYELSIVLPCYNEASAVGKCVTECLDVIQKNSISGEVIVIDNASTDTSADVAAKHGAKVIMETTRGYGAALRRGFKESRGKYIIMMDADNTYDTTQIPEILHHLRNGYEFVNGIRKSDNNENTMPFLHKYIGVPILSWLVRCVSDTKLSDAHCGLRGFTKSKIDELQLESSGMELASEMIIKASRHGLKTIEIKTKLKHRIGDSKLDTFKDGWRHLRLIIIYSPSHFLFAPGLTMILLGLVCQLALLSGPINVMNFSFDYHFMIIGCLITFVGIELTFFGIYGKYLTMVKNITFHDPILEFGEKWLTLEKGLLIGVVLLIIGLTISLYIITIWISYDLSFPNKHMVNHGIFSLTILISGIQVIFGTVLLGVFNIHKNKLS